MFLWVKALHIVFVISWFAAVFYLPRIFVNLAMVEDNNSAEYSRLLLMAHKLSRFGWGLAVLSLLLGLVLMLHYGIGLHGAIWMHAKLTLVGLLVAYYAYCSVLLARFKARTVQQGHIWFRWFNEVPVIVLVLIVLLVVIKPF